LVFVSPNHDHDPSDVSSVDAGGIVGVNQREITRKRMKLCDEAEGS